MSFDPHSATQPLPVSGAQQGSLDQSREAPTMALPAGPVNAVVPLPDQRPPGQRPPDQPPVRLGPPAPQAPPPGHLARPAQPPRTTRPTARVAPRIVAAFTAVAATVLVWLMWRLFVDTTAGQHLERAAFDGAMYGKGQLWALAEPVLDVVSATFVILGILTAMGIALLRRRWGLAVQVAFLVAGANVTTQLIKHVLLDRPNLVGGWQSGNTLPSGHTTVAASVSVALLMVVPRRARAVVALLGAVYTGATGVSTLVGQWHRPSDVAAGLLVVLAWGAAVSVFAPTSSLDRIPPGGSGRAPGSVVTAVVLLAGAVATGLASMWCLQKVHPASWDTSQSLEVTAYIGGALGVVAVTAATFALLLLLRQALARPADL